MGVEYCECFTPVFGEEAKYGNGKCGCVPPESSYCNCGGNPAKCEIFGMYAAEIDEIKEAAEEYKLKAENDRLKKEIDILNESYNTMFEVVDRLTRQKCDLIRENDALRKALNDIRAIVSEVNE